jgi:hypothetical protein
LKGNVRKGEHGTPIVVYKQLPEYTKKDKEGTGEDERVPFVLCHNTVFKVERCDGLTLPEIEQPTTAPEIDEDELCESIVTGWENRPRSISMAPPSTALTTGQVVIPSTCQRGAASWKLGSTTAPYFTSWFDQGPSPLRYTNNLTGTKDRADHTFSQKDAPLELLYCAGLSPQFGQPGRSAGLVWAGDPHARSGVQGL